MLREIVIFVNKSSVPMNDRIKSIMEYYHLSATQFANEIGIQRSALSHIMSGRNKPSLDFVLKLKNRFDEINIDWLFYGKGKMMGESKRVSQDNVSDGTISFPEKVGEGDIELPVVKSENAPVYGLTGRKYDKGLKNESPQSVDQGDSEIDKIIIFYKNGRFKSYKPE